MTVLSVAALNYRPSFVLKRDHIYFVSEKIILFQDNLGPIISCNDLRPVIICIIKTAPIHIYTIYADAASVVSYIIYYFNNLIQNNTIKPFLL